MKVLRPIIKNGERRMRYGKGKLKQLSIVATKIRSMQLKQYIAQVPDIRVGRCLLQIFYLCCILM